MDENDGPSLSIINFMKTTNYVAPSHWKGYREI